MITKILKILTMSKMQRKVLAILVVTIFIATLSAQELGDFRTKWGWANLSNPSAWSQFNGTTWVDANQIPPSPFQKTLYINHYTYFDQDFILEGNMVMAPGTTLDLKTGNELTISELATAQITNILVNTDATLINYGDILSGVNITLTYAAGSGLPAVLINMGRIELLDDGKPYTSSLDLKDGARFISGADAYVYGNGSLATTAQHVRFEIANAGGLNDAIRLTGVRQLQQAHYLFNGSGAQVTGGIGDMVRSLTVDNPAGITLQKNLMVNPWENSVILVKSGSTLNMGPHIIESLDWGNASFILEPGGTVNTAHPEAISSVVVNQKIAFGAIRTNSASYSSAANYVYSGNTLQQSGNFITTPDPYTVNNLIVTNTAGLILNNPLKVNGDLVGGQYIHGDVTLPVTLS
ncbi:MAG: hypothetical protein WC944_11140, partial [Candidatus Cloacimonadaceae bacterium]